MGAGRQVRPLVDGYCLREGGGTESDGMRNAGSDDVSAGTGRARAVCVGHSGILRTAVVCGAWGADSKTGDRRALSDDITGVSQGDGSFVTSAISQKNRPPVIIGRNQLVGQVLESRK